MDSEQISIKIYIDTLFHALEKRYDDRFRAQEKALELALAAKTNHTGTVIAAIGLILAIAALWKH